MNKRISISIAVFFITIFLVTFFCNKAQAQNLRQSQNPNMLYVKIINFTMPMVKVNSFDAEDLAEDTSSVKGKLLSLVGIDLKSPSSILSKEMMPLKGSRENVESKNDSKDVGLKSFTINENEVSTENEQEKNASNQQNPDDNNVVANVYDPKLKKKLDTTKPEVFIYHTHTTESYSGGSNYSSDEAQNVCGVGDALQSELEKNYGIAVVHDKTVHNAYSYTKSYSRSGETVNKYLKKYGDFKIIIDLHRDAVTNKNAVTAKINGENVAKIMFVMARKNPHFQKNMGVVNNLIGISDKLYPGFCKGIHYYDYGTGYFHQNKSNNAMLIEVGANINTLDEAKNSSKYLARVIGQYLNGKK